MDVPPGTLARAASSGEPSRNVHKRFWNLLKINDRTPVAADTKLRLARAHDHATQVAVTFKDISSTVVEDEEKSPTQVCNCRFGAYGDVKGRDHGA